MDENEEWEDIDDKMDEDDGWDDVDDDDDNEGIDDSSDGGDATKVNLNINLDKNQDGMGIGNNESLKRYMEVVNGVDESKGSKDTYKSGKNGKS